MNVALAYETALGTVIRQYANIGGDTHIRVWRNLRFDHRWKEDEDRHMPCVDIRAGIAEPGGDQHTLRLEGQVQCYTNTADDQSHSVISGILEEVHHVLNKLFYGALSGTGNDELTLFDATMTELCGSDYHFGGFTFGNGIMPMDEAGFNAAGLSLVLHYQRSDY
jgi:hypothetical protein